MVLLRFIPDFKRTRSSRFTLKLDVRSGFLPSTLREGKGMSMLSEDGVSFVFRKECKGNFQRTFYTSGSKTEMSPCLI